MKKIITLLTFCFVVNNFLYAGMIAVPFQKKEQSQNKNSVSSMYQEMSAEGFVLLTAKKMEELTGKKLSFTQKISLKRLQKQVKRQLQKGKSVDMNVIARKADWQDNFHLGAYLLGLFLGPIGVLIVYLVQYEDPQVARKSAWRGLLSWLLIGLLVVRLIVGA